MTKDEALKLALEVLRSSQDYKQGRASVVEAVEDIKEALAQPEPDDLTIAYERGFVDGMQKQMQSSVDKAVNKMTPPKPINWVDYEQT